MEQWLLIVAVAVVNTAIVFYNSLVEGSWWALRIAEVVAYERKCGASVKTSLIKEMLRERMVVVNLTLFILDVFLYLGAFFMGILLAGPEKDPWQWTFGAAIFPVLRFLLGEVVSKNLGHNFRMKVALVSVVYLSIILKFTPLAGLLRKLDKWTGGQKRVIQEEDVVATAQAAGEHGTLDTDEVDVIRKFLDVGNKKVGELMTPLKNCRKITSLTTLRLLLQSFGSEEDRPIIVLDAKDQKKVVGVLTADNAIDIMRRQTHEGRLNLSVVAVDTMRVKASDPISKIFKGLRDKPVGLVEGQKGEVIGIITLDEVIAQFTNK